MARPVFNPRKSVIRVKIPVSNYNALLSLGTSVFRGITGNPFYVSPVPALSTLNGNLTDLSIALSSLGSKTNKGSHLALTNVKAKAKLVHDNLTSLAYYVTRIIYQLPFNQQSQALTSSGFASKSPKSKIDKLQLVRSVKANNSKKFPSTLNRISWRKSLGLFKGVKITGYNIYLEGTFVASTTKTNYILPAPTVPTVSTVTIKPVNAQGEGIGQSFSVSRLPV